MFSDLYVWVARGALTTLRGQGYPQGGGITCPQGLCITTLRGRHGCAWRVSGVCGVTSLGASCWAWARRVACRVCVCLPYRGHS